MQKQNIELREINFSYISWEDLKTYEFNDLKSVEERDVTKLKQNIKNNKFSFPFYVWEKEKYVIDGAGRFLALNELEAENYTIPSKLPIIQLDAESKEHAKKLVLSISSQFGDITQESYDWFISDVDLELDDINLNLQTLDLANAKVIDSTDDYGDKNKEIDVNSFEDKMTLSFKFSFDEYNQITQKLRELADTPEEALCKLLEIL